MTTTNEDTIDAKKAKQRARLAKLSAPAESLHEVAPHAVARDCEGLTAQKSNAGWMASRGARTDWLKKDGEK